MATTRTTRRKDTLTDTQRQSLLSQIQSAQQQVNSLYQQRGLPAPNVSQGQTLGASTTGLNAAQLGGASGVGFEDWNTQAEISRATENAANAGVPKSEAGNPLPTTFSKQSAEFALRGLGLSGIVDSKQFEGMSIEQGQRRMQEERQKRLGQTSAMTSFAFNPETMAGTKRITDRVQLTLNDILKDPFSSKGTKNEKIQSILEGGSREIAALFNTPQEFQQALLSNPELQQTMQTFQQLGGKPENIQSKIVPTNTQMPQNAQEYLSGMDNSGIDFFRSNPNANAQAEKMAMEELFPEAQIAQQEIARQNGLSNDMIGLYFGTQENIGIFQLKRAQADEEKRIIEQQQKDDKIAIEKRARLAIDKNNAELASEKAKIEENRLSAKNYMTGMLAKLGALNTTGAAPQALQTLETKYTTATALLENQYKFANREIELKLDESLNSLITERDSNILRVEQDLTKDYETVMKEIMKIEQASEKEIYQITEQFARRQRERTTAYTKQLEAEAEKYAKEFGKIAGGGIDLFSLSQTVDSTLGRAGEKNAITSSITTVKNDIRKNLPANIATKAITELNDEQLRLFLEDYLAERVSRQSSFNPVPFLENWKKNNNIGTEAEDETLY